MIKKLIIFILLAYTLPTLAYVSPENYAVNESDYADYMQIPVTPRPSLDMLFQETLTSEPLKKEEVKKDTKTVNNVTEKKTKKENKKASKEDLKPYQKKLSYKIAKWWVDQRYKREEVHHGTKHEIKVKARMEYENQLNAKIEENLKN